MSTVTRDFKWRSVATYGQGSANTKYVDSYMGSDDYGDGTASNPYKSLAKAYTVMTKSSGNIICRGIFSEEFIAAQDITLRGDYWGAAIFEGRNQYKLAYCYINNLIVRNTPVPTSAPLFLGVGRASFAYVVGNASYAYGCAGPSVMLAEATVYMGILGEGSNGPDGVGDHIVWANPRTHSNFRLQIGSKQNSNWNNTFYKAVITDRCKNNAGAKITSYSLFVDFAMIANEQITYNYCMFSGDSKWYYLTGNTTDQSYEEIVLSGTTSDQRKQSLLDALEEKGVAATAIPVFNNCVFSTQTAAQIFNNPTEYDLTLKTGCDADAKCGTYDYYGALPPAINVPIMTNSAGQVGTWDENSADGCVEITDNKICFKDNAGNSGSILSKVLKINPVTTQLNGIFANFTSKWNNYHAYGNSNSLFGTTEYGIGDTLPVDRYMATDAVTYENNQIGAGGIVLVTQENTTFSSDISTARLIPIKEPNVMEVVYCRCRATVYARVKPADTLFAGATYLNDGEDNITYHSRTIVPGESFIAVTGDLHFSHANTNREIAVLFDDPARVPAQAPWCPAQLFGEYFVAKLHGAIREDAYGVPMSSGNYMSFQSGDLLKSTMDRMYIQFGIFLKRYECNIV